MSRGRYGSHSFSDVMTFTLLTLETVVERLANAVPACSLKISLQREQRVPAEVRESCKCMCVYVCVNLWHSDLLQLNYVVRLSLSWVFLDQGSVSFRWLGFRHPDSVVGGLWKITIFAGHLAKTACCSPPPHTPPPFTTRPAGAGLSSNYIWEDLVKGAASLKL